MYLAVASQADCASAWREAVRAVDSQRGREAYNVIIDVADPTAGLLGRIRASPWSMRFFHPGEADRNRREHDLSGLAVSPARGAGIHRCIHRQSSAESASRRTMVGILFRKNGQLPRCGKRAAKSALEYRRKNEGR